MQDEEEPDTSVGTRQSGRFHGWEHNRSRKLRLVAMNQKIEPSVEGDGEDLLSGFFLRIRGPFGE